MPKKKKGASRGTSPEENNVPVSGQTKPDSAMAAWQDAPGTGTGSPDEPNAEQERVFVEVQEMFKNKIEGDVIYMLLSECDWKVDDALEKLFALAAENEAAQPPQPSTLSMKSVSDALKTVTAEPPPPPSSTAAAGASEPIPINAATTGGMRLDVHARLPTNPNGDQPPTPDYLTMLSPKTPAGVSVEFPEMFLGQHGSSSTRDSAMRSAMEVFGAYANNQQIDILPHYDASKPGFPVSNSFEPTLVPPDQNYTSEMNGINSEYAAQGLYAGPFKQAPPATTANASLIPSVEFGQPRTTNQDFSSNFGYPTAPTERSQNSEQEAVKPTGPVPGLPDVVYNSQGIPVRKGHRKKTLSLDPAEREALESLIGDVIMGGMDEGAIDSESSDTDSSVGEIEKDLSSPKASDTLSPEDQRKFLAGDGGQHERRDGDAAKRAKTEKGKDGGKVYPAQLKVAVKHMKSLPPRFLKRLQTAQKHLEANAKKTGSPEADLRVDPIGWNGGMGSIGGQISPNGKDMLLRDRTRAKEEYTKEEKKKKIRNLLDDLDQYTDETPVIIEEKEEGHDMLVMSSPTSPPNPMSNNVMSCADLEREMVMHTLQQQQHQQPSDVQLSPAEMADQYKMSPMAQRMANLAAASSQTNVMTLSNMAHDSLADYSMASMMAQNTQFSVDAPEFVPKTSFIPPASLSQPPPPMLPGQFPDLVPQSNVSMMSMGQQLPPGVTAEALQALQQQAFLQKPSSPFQTPVGRMSPQVTNTMGRLSPQIITSQAMNVPPPQLSPEQLGRNSPLVMPPKAIPRPMAIPPPSGIVPGYPGYSIPPPPAAFPPRLPAGYQTQFPFRPPFAPHQQQGYGAWSAAEKATFALRGHRPPKDKRHGSPRLGGPRPPRGVMPRMPMPTPVDITGQSMSPEIAKVKVDALLKEGRKVMVILRGAPGSGKSTIAREIQFDGIILNTDEFFVKPNGQYQYDISKLNDAHLWNQARAKDACEQGRNPIIIDNTNTQAWEMKYYVALADENMYHVEIIEPNTHWKYKPKELAKRNQHGVTIETIVRMLERFEKNITPASILATLPKSQKKPVETQETKDQSEEKPAKKTRKRKRKRKRKKGKEGEAAKESEGEEERDDEENRDEEKEVKAEEGESRGEKKPETVEKAPSEEKEDEEVPVKVVLESSSTNDESTEVKKSDKSTEDNEQFEMEDVDAEVENLSLEGGSLLESEEWRKKQRQEGIPRKISVTIADIKEALLQELAECDVLGGDTSSEEEKTSPQSAKSTSPASLASTPSKREPALERIPEHALPPRNQKRERRQGKMISSSEEEDPWAMPASSKSLAIPIETKKKLMTEDWQVPAPYVSDFSLHQYEKSIIHTKDRGTFTTTADIVIMQKIEKGEHIYFPEGPTKMITAKARILTADCDAEPAKIIPTGLVTVDTSTMTEDIGESKGIEFLQSCFPTVTAEDLGEILNQCQGDVEWAVNILLDSGYEYNNSAEVDKTPSSDASKPIDSPILKQPLSLFDLSFNALCPSGDLITSTLEVISESSLHRLQAIEKYWSKTEEPHSDTPLAATPPPDVGVKLDLDLPSNFAASLLQLLGPVAIHSSIETMAPRDMVACLDQKALKEIHRCWTEHITQRLANEDPINEALIHADEALARKLQAEEEEAFHSPRRSASPAKSLRDIMMEEEALEASKNQFIESQAKASGQQGAISTQLKFQQLTDMFPSLGRAMLEEAFKAHRYCLEDTVYALQHVHGPSQPVATRVSAHPPKHKDPQSEFWLTPVEPLESENPTYTDFRSEAFLHYRLRDECFQKAQDAFRRGMKPVASFYSQQGRLHTEKLRQANREAAAAILQHRNANLLENHELDLHGLHVDEALEVLRNILTMKLKECREKSSRCRSHLTVITGRGNHSRRGVARLRPSILDYLQRNGYRFTEPSPGVLRVMLKPRN